MVELYGGTAEPSPSSPRPDPVPDKPVSKMTLEEMAGLIYTNAYFSPWAKDEREPTPKQMAAMAPALRPIIVADIAPRMIASAPGTPAYRRHGGPIMEVVLQTPRKQGEKVGPLTNQLDEIIGVYEAAGVREYSWRVMRPEMKNATWDFITFDPPEEKDKGITGRFREITLPEGSESWTAVDFDSDAAGWKSASAPFGNKGGQLAPQSGRCSNPHCGCSVKPRTLWDKEVILMRRTFDIPPLKDDHRYRLIVGGATHAFSGEGFAVYINGKLFVENPDGYLKKGGVRGGYVSSDFLPELKKGKVTVAVKSFLLYTGHKNKRGATRGHIDVWFEQAKLPQPVLDLDKSEASE